MTDDSWLRNADKSLGSFDNSRSPINAPVINQAPVPEDNLHAPVPVGDHHDRSGHDSIEFQADHQKLRRSTLGHFNKSLNEVLVSEYASGGNFRKTAAERAIQLINLFKHHKVQDQALPDRFKTQQEAFEAKISFKEFQELETESKMYINDARHLKNMYLILSALALINQREDVYTHCATKLGSMSLGVYSKARVRTDQKIRNLLNLTLQAAIVMCNSALVKQLLIWGRQNTMMLQVNEEWLIIALHVCDEQKETMTTIKNRQGDRKLLEALLNYQVVVKPSSQQDTKQFIDRIETDYYDRRASLMKKLQGQKFDIGGRKSSGTQLIKVLQQTTALQFMNQSKDQGNQLLSLNNFTAEKFQRQASAQTSLKKNIGPRGEDHKNEPKRLESECTETVSGGMFQKKLSLFGKKRTDFFASQSDLQEDTGRDMDDHMNASWSTTNLLNKPGGSKKNINDLLDGSKQKEKYLRLVHLVQLTIDRIRRNKTNYKELVRVIWLCATVVESVDLERCVCFLYNEDKINVIFAVLKMLEAEGREQEVKSELSMLIYLEGLTRQQIHICMRIMESQEDVLLRNDNRVLTSLLQSLIDSPFYMDNKLAMVKRFLPKIQFQHVDILVTNLQKLVSDSDQTNGIFVCNINPFLVAATILYICDRIKSDYPLAKLRIQAFEGLLIDRMILLLNNVYDPYKVSLLLKQTDIENYSTLDLMSKLKMYRAMQTKVADRVIQDTWVSKVDVSGSFLENSTAYDYLVFGNLNGNIDFEQRKRFYHSRDLTLDVRPHRFAYRVWSESMNLRYFFEMCFFTICVILFQYFISAFNTDMHKLMTDVEILIEEGVFDRDENGRVLIRDYNPVVRMISTEGTEADYAFDKNDYTIEQVKAHLAYEIELAVLELDEAMYIAMISFSFPFQFLMAYIYAVYTKRNMIIRTTTFVDMAIFACVVVWFEKFEVYIHDDNMGFGLTDPPHRYHRFMQRMMNDNTSGDFHFDWLLAATAFLFWIRLVFMLQLTSVFGPLIRTTAALMKDLITFFMLFTIQLIAFSCVGILCFGSIPEYDNLQDAFIMFFQTSLGEWDFEIYDKLGDGKKYFGIVFHVIVICVNMLLLLNLVIAIMSTTYAEFAEVKLGLYLQGIIEAIPSYKNNKQYGGLIVMTPPLNMIAYLLLPFYHCIKDKQKLRSFNSVVCKVIYSPLAIMITVCFEAVSLILTPFAWLKVVVQKCKLGKRTGKGTYYASAIIYFVIGLPLLAFTSLVDCYWFFKHLYQWKMTRAQEKNAYPKISLKAFNRFFHTVHQQRGQTCNAKQLVLELRDQCRTTECIFAVLYANKTDILEKKSTFTEKDAALNKLSGPIGNTDKASMTLSKQQQKKIMEGIDYNLRGINTFNLFKRVVWSCVTDRPNGDNLDGSSLVNLPLLKGLLNEIHSEIYVSDFIQQQQDYGRNNYEKIDITAYKGFDDYKEVDDKAEISKQVAQVVLIDPMTIIKAITSVQATSANAQSLQQEKGKQKDFGVENLDASPEPARESTLKISSAENAAAKLFKKSAFCETETQDEDFKMKKSGLNFSRKKTSMSEEQSHQLHSLQLLQEIKSLIQNQKGNSENNTNSKENVF